jgi:hypothetical protein
MTDMQAGTSIPDCLTTRVKSTTVPTMVDVAARKIEECREEEASGPAAAPSHRKDKDI